jgi:hypothetical protein
MDSETRRPMVSACLCIHDAGPQNVVLEASNSKEMKFSTVEWPIDVIVMTVMVIDMNLPHRQTDRKNLKESNFSSRTASNGGESH